MSRLIKALLIDLNNVAEDYPTFAKDIPLVVRSVAARIAERFGGTPGDISQELDDYTRQVATPHLHHYPGLWQYVAERKAGRLLENDEVDELFGWYLEEYKRRIRIHEDFVPFLQKCSSAGLRTGIVANGNARRIGVFVDRFGFRQLTNTVVASGATPFQKPAVELFALALRNIGVSAHEAAFIGDRPDTDIRGANETGMWSVRLLRGPSASAEPRGQAEIPDAVLGTLEEFWKTPLAQQELTLDSAVIMAGGRGTRMEELTAHRQKCLLPAGEAPILGRVLANLVAGGIRRFHFLLQYRPEDVVTFIRDRFPRLDAHFHQVQASETGAAVASLLDVLPTRFVYSHGNIVVPSHVVSRLIKASYHEPDQSWFAATPRSDVAPTHPVFLVESGRVQAVMRHRPELSGGRLLYSVGLGVIARKNLERKFDSFETTEQLWQTSPSALRLLEYAGDWWHLENPSDLERYRLDSQRWTYV